MARSKFSVFSSQLREPSVIVHQKAVQIRLAWVEPSTSHSSRPALGGALRRVVGCGKLAVSALARLVGFFSVAGVGLR